MFCGPILAAALAFGDPAAAVAAVETPPVAPVVAPTPVPASVASEPLYADIIGRSTTLRGVVDAWLAGDAAQDAAFASGAAFTDFRAQTVALADLDMQGHRDLAARGTDGDLKCILRGISEDMPLKVQAVADATTPESRATALTELRYLLNDTIEVITSPPQPPV